MDVNFDSDISFLDIEFRDPSPWKVLVADDSSSHVKILSDILSNAPHRLDITVASTGGDALELLETVSYDMAFIDMTMPGLTGNEVVERASSHHRMPFYAVVSSNNDHSLIETMKGLSAYDYILKPYQKGDIFRVLQTFQRTKLQQNFLVIDDSTTTRRIISKIFDRSIFNVFMLEASDGITGFEVFVSKHPDVVFIDMNMPLISGIDTYRIIKAHSPNAVIVFMSSNQNDLDGLDFGKSVFKLKKPFYSGDIDKIIHFVYGIRLPFEVL